MKRNMENRGKWRESRDTEKEITTKITENHIPRNKEIDREVRGKTEIRDIDIRQKRIENLDLWYVHLKNVD